LHNVLAMFWQHSTASANKQYTMFWIASWTNRRVLQSTVGMTVMIQGPWTGRWTEFTDNWSLFVRCCFVVNDIIDLIACLQYFTVFWIGGEGAGECYIITRGWSSKLLYDVIWGRRGVKKSTFFALYIGWSDVTYLWSQCDRHFVGQHVILYVVKWWRFVALFE